jgi:hypothetical protein
VYNASIRWYKKQFFVVRGRQEEKAKTEEEDSHAAILGRHHVKYGQAKPCDLPLIDFSVVLFVLRP